MTIAWRAILGSPLRSMLTALGVIIGVAAVIALTAIGAGSTAGITRNLEALGTNLLTVGSVRGFGGGGGSLVRGGPRQTITLKDAEAIAALDSARIAGEDKILSDQQVTALDDHDLKRQEERRAARQKAGNNPQGGGFRLPGLPGGAFGGGQARQGQGGPFNPFKQGRQADALKAYIALLHKK